jgi:hypothetical protein
MRIKCDEGTFGGVAEPYAITTSLYKFGGTSTTFSKNSNWQEFTVNLTTPGKPDPGYDPTQVVIFGVQLSSGGAGAAQGPVTFHIDSVSITGLAAPPAPDAGTTSDASGN